MDSDGIWIWSSFKSLLHSIKSKFNESRTNKALICTGSIFSILMGRYIYCKLNKKINKLPSGPIGIPYFGSLFHFARDPIKFFDERYKKDGEISCFNFGGKPIILLNTTTAANIILKHKNCTGRFHIVEPVNMGFHYPSRFAFIDNTKNCKYRRKLFKSQLISSLNTSYFENYVKDLLKNILFVSLNKKCAENSLFYPRKEMFHLIFLTIFQTVITDKIIIDINDKNYNKFDCLASECNQIGVFMTILGIQFNFNNYIVKYLDKITKYSQKATELLNIYNNWMYNSIGFKFDLINNQIICRSDKIKNKLLDGNDDKYTYLQVLIKEYYNNNIDARTIYSDVNMTFVAGIETTGNTMDFILCSLAKYTKIQSDIYNELVNNKSNQNNYIGIKKLNKCNKLRMFIYECLRVSSIVSTSVPRKVTKDIKYKDYVLPKNSEIWVNMRECNVNCNEWKYNEFCLLNWSDNNGKFKYNDNLMSFGVGVRDCAGKSVALKSLLYYTANIVLNYQIDGPNGDNNFLIIQDQNIVKLINPQIGLKVSKRT